MAHNPTPTSWVFLCGLLLGMQCSSSAVQYRPFLIPTPDGADSQAEGISNSGIVLGEFLSGSPTRYFLWTPATGIVGFGSNDVGFRAGPNAIGQVAGARNSAPVVREPDGTVRDLDYVGTADSSAEVLAISDSGLAIGYSGSEESQPPAIWDLATGHAVQIGTTGYHEGVTSAAISGSGFASWTNWQTVIHPEGYPGPHTEILDRTFRRSPSGAVAELTPPSTDKVWGTIGIANDGTVLLSGSYPSTYYLWGLDNTLTQLPLDWVSAMSDEGLIVGAVGTRRVVLGTDGNLSDLPLPDGAVGASAFDINDAGVVVGRVTFAEYDRAVLWEPVPEPASLSTLALALAGVGVGVARRRR